MTPQPNPRSGRGLVFGSPEANRIRDADQAAARARRELAGTRERVNHLIAHHGGLEAAIAAQRRRLSLPALDNADDKTERDESWTDLQALLARRKSVRRALNRAARKEHRP